MVSQIDEQTEKALNDEAEEINSRNATPALEEQAAEEVTEAEVEPTGETEEEVTETAGEEPKKGFQSRVRELNQKARAAEERAKSLEDKLAELTNPTPQPGFSQSGQNQTQYDPNEPLIAPGEEIDINELNRRQTAREQRILQQADSMAQIRAKQSEAITRINSEASEVIRAYPELDPESESFDKELSDTIAEATEAYVKANPYSASVKKFVGRLMKPLKGAVDREVGQATASIAKQASQTALRPNSIRKPEKQAAEKSIAELEAELGIINS